MNKFDTLIVTVPNTALFPDGIHPEGFIPHEERDMRSIILSNFGYTHRGDAEVDFTLKQPISYAIIRNTEGKIFAYQRGDKRTEAHETRLAGKWACGIGGHIEKEDEAGDILADSLIRELEEEITLHGKILSVNPIGYINSEKDEVSKVHIGVLYVIDTDSKTAEGSEEVVNEGFYTPEELHEMMQNPDTIWEEWTKIALKAVIG
ncbi:NUDIX domain-containing protein [Candidatus Peribacteria bacterium]|nr:NUDIX domain-containing protein [Candidatus Peribacteria bacterium]